MTEAGVYIRTDSGMRSSLKQYAYVLECSVRGELHTKESFGRMEGTLHRVTLTAIAEALERFKKPCRICIHAEDTFVLNAMESSLAEWVNAGFVSKSGEPVANGAEWRRLWLAMQGHEVTVQAGKHTYCAWLDKEMEKRRETDV